MFPGPFLRRRQISETVLYFSSLPIGNVFSPAISASRAGKLALVIRTSTLWEKGSSACIINEARSVLWYVGTRSGAVLREQTTRRRKGRNQL